MEDFILRFGHSFNYFSSFNVRMLEIFMKSNLIFDTNCDFQQPIQCINTLYNYLTI